MASDVARAARGRDLIWWRGAFRVPHQWQPRLGDRWGHAGNAHQTSVAVAVSELRRAASARNSGKV